MTSHQIECFIKAGEELSFTRAAEILMLPQPAISRYVAALEKELQTKLFVRERNKKLTLTEEGKIYFNMFLRFYTEFKNTRESLNTPLLPLRFGYNFGWNIALFFPKVLDLCRKQHADFAITIECMKFRELTDKLLSGQLDVVLILAPYVSKNNDFAHEHITSIKRVIMYSDQLFPALENFPPRPEDFYAYDFLVANDELVQKLSADIENYCKPYHFVPKLKTVANMETVLANVENGLGVALFDEWGQNLTSPHIHHVELDSSHMVSLAWRRDAALPAIHILKNALLTYFSIT